MIIIFGLVVLIAAVVIAVAGVLGNAGSGHALIHEFAVFGYHVTGSTGTLFLYGIVVGAIGVAGLSLLLAGARRTSRRGSAARRGLRQSRQETAAVSRDRDALIDRVANELGFHRILPEGPLRERDPQELKARDAPWLFPM